MQNSDRSRLKTTQLYKAVCKTACLSLTFLILTVYGCQQDHYMIKLMPAPDIYDNGTVDPFTDHNPITDIPYQGMLYATDREPSAGSGEFYSRERGGLLRLGVGSIEIGNQEITWEEARRVSLMKNRTDNYPLKLTRVEELGILDRSFHMFMPQDLIPEDPHAPARRFAGHIDAKLDKSNVKDIFIYVHGFKVVFNNPLLVAAELWHFLGYEGVFIAFAWPSTPSNRAYVADLESAVLSSQNFRIFLEYLAEETSTRRIHIIGYSAGTRVVINALKQIALIHRGDSRDTIQAKMKLGHIILVGSDFDTQLFGSYIVEGLLNVPQTMSVYVSENDKALGISKWLFTRKRLGQMAADRDMVPNVQRFLRDNDQLEFIDVTDAEGSSTGNGHAYFRKSPWVSSDILITLMFDLKPNERGLVQHDHIPVWKYPDDYLDRLRSLLIKAENG